MTDTQHDPRFMAALPAITDVAERLEAEGFTRSEIADALMSAGLTIGTHETGPLTTARMLTQLAERFFADAQQSASAPRH